MNSLKKDKDQLAPISKERLEKYAEQIKLKMFIKF